MVATFDLVRRNFDMLFEPRRAQRVLHDDALPHRLRLLLPLCWWRWLRCCNILDLLLLNLRLRKLLNKEIKALLKRSWSCYFIFYASLWALHWRNIVLVEGFHLGACYDLWGDDLV
jgi:hypothetical protein